MTLLDSNIATRMSRFWVIASISLGACSTPLVGSIQCDDMTCGTGQICREAKAEPDDGGIPAQCLEVPATCPISDCDPDHGGCSSCIDRLCDCTAGQCYVIVRGRTIRC